MRASEATPGGYGAFGGSDSYYTRENIGILIRVDINKPTIPLKPTGGKVVPFLGFSPVEMRGIAGAGRLRERDGRMTVIARRVAPSARPARTAPRDVGHCARNARGGGR